MTQPVFRFAPSPNGRLHLGHAFSALLNEDLAKRSGGRFLLRIEDIDVARCRPEFEEGVRRDLAWLGLAWEEPVRRQSEHFDVYRAACARLKARGLIYRCSCTRKEIAEAVVAIEAGSGQPWPRDPDGAPLYPATCRPSGGRAEGAVSPEVGFALRLDMAAALAIAPGPHPFVTFDPDAGERQHEARPELWGDPVIVRKEIPTSYHLSVVVDDALQGVTHVVRGTDLEAATDLHVLLQALLGLPTPLYRHHGLILDRLGDKLSKSLGSEAIADLRGRGVTAREIRERLGFPPQPTPST